jgi:GT2 family glycosyltransferase
MRGRQEVTSRRISVVICAYTEARWNQTLAAIESVRAQSMPAQEIIVVVDHNSALYGRLAAALPDIRVAESSGAPGLSGAKNTGVALARSEILAFLDDDAVAAPDWLRSLADSFADPRVIGAGGLALPRWETERPRWFPAEFDWVIGCNDVRMPRFVARVRNLMGGNMLLRREAFGLAGEFRAGIGRSAGKQPLGCEDTEFCIRLSQQSPAAVLVYDSRAVIWHLVPAARCRFSYFVSRCFGEGLSKAAVAAAVGARDGLSAERHYAASILPRGIIQGIADLLHGDPWGLIRAGAIVAGLAVTAAGYTAGSLTGATSADRLPPANPHPTTGAG